MFRFLGAGQKTGGELANLETHFFFFFLMYVHVFLQEKCLNILSDASRDSEPFVTEPDGG